MNMNFLTKLTNKVKTRLQTKANIKSGNTVLVANILLILFQTTYLYLRYKFVNEQVPFWFTQSWGDDMLASKRLLFILPLSGFTILCAGVLLEFSFRKHFVRYLKGVLLSFTTLTNLLLTASLIRIVFVASSPFPPLVSPLVLSLLIPFVSAFLLTYFLLPAFINFAFENDIVTNPKIHMHPAMLLQRATARGGGSFYALVFLVLSFLFVGAPGYLTGFYVSVLMLGVLGFVDDYQNTHVKSGFKSIENPGLRLLLVFAAVAVLVFSGVLITTFGNPFGGMIDLLQYKIAFGNAQTSLLAYIFTVLWVAWVLNLLSWSNGIDGQYSGIIGISSLFICILALRFSPFTDFHARVAVMAAISAGIAFGFTKYTWYPSSIMWGFGAMSAGMVVAALSILINTKILISVLILLIPFLDASVTFVRRMLQKKSPLKGDRGHFHHLLLDLGWPIQKIAKFYWGTTFLFGMIGLLGSDKFLLQSVLIVGGLLAFVIVLMNLRSLKQQ